ncbi:MAG: hypothetical protein Q4G15_07425 [Lachnospiraceae bacterium]|nr:hypothetical protein [Lachnospiraceae bacterium]
MRYRMEYTNKRRCDYVNGRNELLQKLKEKKDKSIEDIRKIYKSGVTDSVMDNYKRYL